MRRYALMGAKQPASGLARSPTSPDAVIFVFGLHALFAGNFCPVGAATAMFAAVRCGRVVHCLNCAEFPGSPPNLWNTEFRDVGG